jgi:hypothetical protein
LARAVNTPPLASDLYGCHKLVAENNVRSSRLAWSILRLSGVITLDPLIDHGDFDSFNFGASMPDDGWKPGRCDWRPQ